MANPDAREFDNPDPQGTGKVPWCQYIKFWWDNDLSNALDELGSVYPGRVQYADEWVLYEANLNSLIKHNVSAL